MSPRDPLPRDPVWRHNPPAGQRSTSSGAYRLALITFAAAVVLATAGGAAAGEPDTPELITAVPAMREVALVGFTRARAELPLVAETDGRVQEIFGDVGDTIDASGRFAQLDTTFLRLDLEEIDAQQDRLRSQLEFDQREVARVRELVRQSSASASQLDALDRAVQDNGHALRAMDVKRRMLTERLARAAVLAPAGSRITVRAIEVGQWVHAGETLGRAADFSVLLVPFALTPEQFAALEQSAGALTLELLDRVEGVEGVAADAGRPPALGARLYRVNPGFDSATRKIAVELALTDALPDMRGGLRVRLRLRLPEGTGAVSLPERALSDSYEETWVMLEDGRRLPVLRLGVDANDPDLVRVTAPGLSPGDRVRSREDS
jgi:RND family efflux transporter MFP subunit